MPELNNVIDILKLLDKSNCGKCREKTCFAFAAKVHKGDRELADCPAISQEVLKLYGGGKVKKRHSSDDELSLAINTLKKAISKVDLAEAAKRLGGRMVNNRLTIKMLGKDVGIDSSGNIFTDIHVHPWVAAPLFNYILEGKGVEPSGQWVPYRDLPNGIDGHLLLDQRTKKQMRKMADSLPGLFNDLVHLFNGKEVKGHFDADIGCVLHPLPKVPILICYWKPEDGLDSDFHMFFDAMAEENLSIEFIFALATGICTMFEKIFQRHGH